MVMKKKTKRERGAEPPPLLAMVCLVAPRSTDKNLKTKNRESKLSVCWR
jgi:hypothetical protein